MLFFRSSQLGALISVRLGELHPFPTLLCAFVDIVVELASDWIGTARRTTVFPFCHESLHAMEIGALGTKRILLGS